MLLKPTLHTIITISALVQTIICHLDYSNSFYWISMLPKLESLQSCFLKESKILNLPLKLHSNMGIISYPSTYCFMLLPVFQPIPLPSIIKYPIF